VSDDIATLKKNLFIISKKYDFLGYDFTSIRDQLHTAKATIALLEHDIEVYKKEIVNMRERAEEELKKAAHEAYEAKLEAKHAKRELNQLKKQTK
jgi:predicted phosphohydrolase